MIENNRYYWTHLKTRNVTVRVQPKDDPMGVVFQVKNMVDSGKGRQMVVLTHVDHLDQAFRRPKQGDVAVPFKMGDLDFVYTSRQNPCMQNVAVLLGCLYQGQQVERIVLDVLSPGDILVFRRQKGETNMNIAEAFRVVRQDAYVRTVAGYAV